MKIFAMNIYMGIFSKKQNINMFMRIKSHEYLQDQAHLLVVDLLHPRILQADALLMHRSAEKKELTFDTFLDALASLKPHYWSKFPHFFRLLR